MNTFKNIQKIVATIMVLLATHIHSFGADATAPAPAEPMISTQNIALYVLASVIVLFVFIIFVMSNAIKIAGKSYSDKIKQARIESSKKLPLVIIFTLLSSSLFAQTAEGVTKPNAFDNVDLYLLGTVVFLLFIVVLVLVRTLFILMGIKKTEEAMSLNPDGSPSRVRTWFQKFNETVPIEDEASLDMSHDYDGIRELDNKIPSWWTWAFFSLCFL
jgi:cytochrome c oxidase cbb3-type subunit 3